MFRKVYGFIFENYDYLLFVILLIISFIILLSNDNPQVRKIQGSISSTFKFIHYPGQWIEQLSGLVEENRELKADNMRLALLNTELKEAYIENQRLREMLDFVDSTQLNLLAARVLNQGTTTVYNSILINAGAEQRVKKDMAVLSTDGIVGKTVSIGKNTSLVQLFNDINFRLSVRFQTSRHVGIMQPAGSGYTKVEEIPKTVVIHPGEIVITSGYSDIYPGEIKVGEVVDIKQSANGLYQIAQIRPYVDLNSIEEVFIVISGPCYEN